MKPLQALCAAIVSLILASCSQEADSRPAAPTSLSHAAVTVVRSASADEIYEAVASVQSRRKITLMAKVGGDIVAMHVKEGDMVRAEESLLEIDDRYPASRTKQAEAGLKEAQSALEEVKHAIRAAQSAESSAQINLRLAASTLERFTMLRDSKSVSPHEFEEVEARHEAAKAEVDRANASLQALESKREQVRARIEEARSEVEASAISLGNTRVRSPLDGIVTTRFIEAGSQVAPGALLLTIESNGYEVDAVVPESLAMNLRPGLAVRVQVPSLAIENAHATITTVVPAVDSSTRSYVVKADLPSVAKDVRLASGMFAKVLIPNGARTVLAIPATAVVERGQLSGVFVVDESNVIRLRLIRTGERRGDLVEVLSGLAAGDRTIFQPDPSVKDGATWQP